MKKIVYMEVRFYLDFVTLKMPDLEFIADIR